jgi:tetratricopeptide (TPR) repeat protein
MRKAAYLLLSGFICLVCGNYFSVSHIDAGLKRNLYPPKDIKHFTLGFDEAFADSFWLRFLQDVDLCQDGMTHYERREAFEQRQAQMEAETPRPTRVEGENTAHLHTVLAEESYVPKCQKGWAYAMLDAVTELAPKFYLPYAFGGGVLSIIAEDREGAKLIMEKGLQVFPTDWNLHYRLAYHYLYELRQPEPAAAHMRKAALYGAPGWVYALAGRLYSESGQLDLGIQILEQALKTFQSSQEAGSALNRG